MKRWEWVGLCAAFTVAVSLPACGDDDEKSPGDDVAAGESGKTNSAGKANGGSSAGGRSGAGTGGLGPAPEPVACGEALCMPRGVPTAGIAIGACCVDEAEGACGLETEQLAAFGVQPTTACEPLDQPGELDDSCPMSPPVEMSTITLPPFAGCCRPTGECGYMLDTVLGFLSVGLGCIDATPFLAGEAPTRCGDREAEPGGEGAAGSGGAAGAPN